MASIKHKGWKWSKADASNPALVMVLEDTSKAVHITDGSDQNTDWNVAADSHPSVYVHSATTPATDYVKIYHDATNGYIDSVGGNLILAIAGTSEITLTASAMSPTTSDGNALGTTSLMWGDLFLASGGVINFNAGDVTLTHAANALTIDGGSVTLATGFNLSVGGASAGAATNTAIVANGTTPAAGVADSVQVYSIDDAAGHTIPGFYCEGTNVVATAQADVVSSVRVKIAINGITRTFLCI